MDFNIFFQFFNGDVPFFIFMVQIGYGHRNFIDFFKGFVSGFGNAFIDAFRQLIYLLALGYDGTDNFRNFRTDGFYFLVSVDEKFCFLRLVVHLEPPS